MRGPQSEALEHRECDLRALAVEVGSPYQAGEKTWKLIRKNSNQGAPIYPRPPAVTHLKKLAGLPGAGLCAKKSPPPSLATTQLDSRRAGVPGGGGGGGAGMLSEAFCIICSNT